jgi:hypothetical protein
MRQDAVAAGILATLVAVAALYAVYFCHSAWRLYARFSLDWETRALLYETSFERLAQLKYELGEGEGVDVIDLLLQHDVQGLRLCRHFANLWRQRIPRRVRRLYLRSSKWAG